MVRRGGRWAGRPLDTMQQQRIQTLRERHPTLTYDSVRTERDGTALCVRYRFVLAPDIVFAPSTRIEGVDWERVEEVGADAIQVLTFHLGLVEMLSYWKAACAPEIVVRAGQLSHPQIEWWRDLLVRGMGEYFLVNDIDFTAPDLVQIRCEGNEAPQRRCSLNLRDRDLVLVSGGKDSAVVLETMRRKAGEFGCLLLNPVPAAMRAASHPGNGERIIVQREIDARLLELNREGFLNGHTPFSAYLAFLSIACCVLFDYRRAIAGNERSSEEGNARFRGQEINHQYSKTLEFERKLRAYVRDHVSAEIDYFSLLRPLYELQIARQFTRCRDYFADFRSCNRWMREDGWCGRCPKCVSVFTLLYPFLDDRDLVRIFGRNLFDDEATLPMLRDLAGLGERKPFECVGTREETAVALELAVEKARRQSGAMPVVVAHVASEILPRTPLSAGARDRVLAGWTDEHCLPSAYRDLVRQLAHVDELR